MKFTRNVRSDGRIEAVCPHGIGHTIFAPKALGKRIGFIHGCDWCCESLTPKAKRRLITGEKEVEV